MKPAIEQVSEQYEKAKREYFQLQSAPAEWDSEALRSRNDKLIQLRERMHVWGEALHILQQCRGHSI